MSEPGSAGPPAVGPAERPFQIMGVVNVTPDSFSDGGLYLAPDQAVAHGLELVEEGADILDVGGESTRPGAEPVSAEEERRRVLPVIEGLAEAGAVDADAGGVDAEAGAVDAGAGGGASAPARAQISIDTSKASVASAALEAGATMVNDVTALRGDPEMASVVADAGVDCCLMHMLGEPRTMQDDPRYEDVVDDVRAFLEERLAFALANGIAPQRIALDPGIGFGKTLEHNLELLRRLDELTAIGQPLVIGTSRKSFLGRLTARSDPAQRVPGTIATCLIAYQRGARIFRVHDVAPVRDALVVAAATVGQPWKTTTSTR